MSQNTRLNPDLSPSNVSKLALVVSLIVCGWAEVGIAADEPDQDALAEIVVTADRRAVSVLEQSGNIAVLPTEELKRVNATHPHELLLQVPGTWVSRGSGQEHLTAIRSPVLTGAGSCGAFLILDDGIPIRPSGFCNVNQLFEVFAGAASRLEVIRGPANALYGSNALHGVMNFLPTTLDEVWDSASIEIGANDYRRLSLATARSGRFGITTQFVKDGGFRDATGFEQQKLRARWRTNLAEGVLTTGFSATHLDQETAGFILGQDSYRNADLRRSNPNPEAFREAESARLYAIWQGRIGSLDADFRPYVRYSDMRFLQHFLPGKPLEENGHTSAGLNSLVTQEIGRATLQLGADLEWSDVRLTQSQAATTSGSAFLMETRPQGLHYDFDVQSTSVAAYVQWQMPLTESITLSTGLRAERSEYTYDNRMLNGNTRDDGSPCGFGGCLYSRPADRSDDFVNVAPTASLLWRSSEQSSLFVQIGRGFRAPQMTELYRLQSGQQVSDLDSETLDQAELGWRYRTERSSAELALYASRKRDSVLRDSDGFNVSGGRSKHRGVEFQLRHRLSDNVELAGALTFAKHTYDFDFRAARGETFQQGNDVDTAPRQMGNLQFVWRPAANSRVSLDWNFVSEYFLDTENQHTYPGHSLLNVTLEQQFSPSFSVVARVRNLLDAVVADRADFAFGNYRYFPGRSRELFLEFIYVPDRKARSIR